MGLFLLLALPTQNFVKFEPPTLDHQGTVYKGFVSLFGVLTAQELAGDALALVLPPPQVQPQDPDASPRGPVEVQPRAPVTLLELTRTRDRTLFLLRDRRTPSFLFLFPLFFFF